MRRILFTVEYDGTDYHGWQAQAGLTTIQGELASALEAQFGFPIQVDGASRTDAGVHARGQAAAISLDHPISLKGFVKALNQRLPSQIAIRDAREVEPDFVPRFKSLGKTYIYRFYCSKERWPLIDRYAWRVFWPLNFERLLESTPYLIGTHDFESFADSDGTHQTSIRTITRIAFAPDPQIPGLYALTFCGTAFLKHMIRNLTGTLIEIARGRLRPEQIPQMLAARDRSASGPSAPACGLTLERVHFAL